jgi:hypothetical protein
MVLRVPVVELELAGPLALPYHGTMVPSYVLHVYVRTHVHVYVIRTGVRTYVRTWYSSTHASGVSIPDAIVTMVWYTTDVLPYQLTSDGIARYSSTVCTSMVLEYVYGRVKDGVAVANGQVSQLRFPTPDQHQDHWHHMVAWSGQQTTGVVKTCPEIGSSILPLLSLRGELGHA